MQAKRPTAFVARGPKKELILKSFQELERLGGGSFESGVEFASPCFLASRRRSDKLRLCIATMILNSLTKDEIYQMPSINDLINMLKGSCVFSILDVRFAYNQVPLTTRAQHFVQ